MISASTPLLLDTNILIHLARGGTAAQRLESAYALTERRLTPFISVVTVGELLSFATRNGWGDARLAALEQLVSHLVVVDISREPVLRAYAAFDAQLTGAGMRMGQQNDLWIAATAAATGAIVLTTDKDFDVLHPGSIQREWVDPDTLR
ncbi:MAG TPA: type II toxin-antitoxin system VapC family toxin [Longimicrobium sp.]|nr:type II toxin-antitoxin system VapC family toxin [Longimicrobium sp.]